MRFFESTPSAYPAEWPPVLLHHYFLHYAKITPDACAIMYMDQRWSYKEFADQAYTYADVLDKGGVGPGDRVILEFEPCPQALALMAACSMLGAIYIPLSPENPQARVDYVLETTEACIHLQGTSSLRALPRKEQLIRGVVAGNDLTVDGVLPRHLQIRRGPVIESDIAYIIFTSGTTGRPKGIKMTHRAVLSFFRGAVDHCKFTPETRVGTIAPLQFDASLVDMGLAFGSGATLLQIPRILFHHPKRLIKYLDQHQATHLTIVPSMWSKILHYAAEEIGNLTHLKSMIFGGEAIPVPDLLQLEAMHPGLRIINCYGPTECIVCSFTEVPNPLPAGKNVSIGYAIPGAEMLIIDAHGNEILDQGKAGVIHIRGATLFSGYWRDDDATAKALVPHPLRPLSGERVFRTGDMAYKGKNNELYFSGREDFQIKILGNRIELEEVDRRLCEHSAVTAAAAVLVQRQENPALIAFVVLRNDIVAPTKEDLLKFCREMLPKYIVPAELHFVDSLPTNINDKVDRKALKEVWEQSINSLEN